MEKKDITEVLRDTLDDDYIKDAFEIIAPWDDKAGDKVIEWMKKDSTKK